MRRLCPARPCGGGGDPAAVSRAGLVPGAAEGKPPGGCVKARQRALPRSVPAFLMQPPCCHLFALAFVVCGVLGVCELAGRQRPR